MNKRLLIIDGHNLLFQMFFGMPSRILGKDGKAIQGVIGFIGATNKLIDMIHPTHVAVLFDSETHNPRTDILGEYKANRPDYTEASEKENPFTQLPGIYRALDFMGIMHAEIMDAECDDVIASYAIGAPSDTEIYISSFDSDYYQLISDTVRVIRYRGDASSICDKEYIKTKLGIAPELYADYKCLVGDPSDNIKGIRGIGPKTAAKIINCYGSIDNMTASPGIITEEKIRYAICANIDILKRNYALIHLDDHASIPFDYEELIFSHERFKTMDIIRCIGL